MFWSVLLTGPLYAQGNEAQVDVQVQQAVQSLGLEKLLSAAAEQVLSELPEHAARELLAAELAGPMLQARLVVQMQKAWQATFVEAQWALSADNVVQLQRQCHQQLAHDKSAALANYQAQLQSRAPLEERAVLAKAMADLSRSAQLAAQAQANLERISYQLINPQSVVDWPAVEAQREADNREALLAWYLYCGRTASSESWQALLDAYRKPAVQALLDAYAQALTLSLQQAEESINARAP